MLRKHAIIIITLIGFALLVAMCMGCQSEKSGEKPVSDPDDGGRAVTPVSNDPDSGEGGGQYRPVPTGPASGRSLVPHENPDPPPPSTGRNPNAEINIALMVDGNRYPVDQPIFVNDGEQKQIEFLIGAAGSQLASYRIQSGAPIDIPKEGELQGYTATIPYVFTFNSRTWGEEGIIIRVTNQQGDTNLSNVTIISPLDSGIVRPPE